VTFIFHYFNNSGGNALFVLPSTLGSFDWTDQFFPALICKTIMQFFILLLFSFSYILPALLSSEYCLLWTNVNCWCYQRDSSISVCISCHCRVTFEV